MCVCVCLWMVGGVCKEEFFAVNNECVGEEMSFFKFQFLNYERATNCPAQIRVLFFTFEIMFPIL